MYQLPEHEHAAAIAAINRKQYPGKPLLANSVFKKSEKHDVMLFHVGELHGDTATFAAVKGASTWAMYFAYGNRSPEHVALKGNKMPIEQVKKIIDIEGSLDEFYRN